MEITYSLIKVESRNDLIKFIHSVDNDFEPALGKRVNINEYADKVLNNGYCYAAFDGQSIVGAIMFYCNDQIYKKAYITLIGVVTEYRRMDIGRNLMRMAVKKSTKNGMERIGVHTRESNDISIRLYKNMGFEILCKDPDGIVDRLYLEKVLR